MHFPSHSHQLPPASQIQSQVPPQPGGGGGGSVVGTGSQGVLASTQSLPLLQSASGGRHGKQSPEQLPLFCTHPSTGLQIQLQPVHPPSGSGVVVVPGSAVVVVLQSQVVVVVLGSPVVVVDVVVVVHSTSGATSPAAQPVKVHSPSLSPQ